MLPSDAAARAGDDRDFSVEKTHVTPPNGVE
jgi:hypothetical protein